VHCYCRLFRTKKATRYHPPEVLEASAELQRCREHLEVEAERSWTAFLSDFHDSYHLYRPIIAKIAAADVIFALAQVANRPGYVRPKMVAADRPHTLSIVGGRHPMVEVVALDHFVPNDIRLSREAERFMIITGPNMGGKSSYMRQIALIVIM
jgi:DNA mismatch repair protein MSH3